MQIYRTTYMHKYVFTVYCRGLMSKETSFSNLTSKDKVNKEK
jgi:hypothetical protein